MADQELPAIRASNPIVSAIGDLVYLTRTGPRAAGLAEEVAHTGDNLAAAVAPGVNDDSTVPYIVGSLWIDTTANKAYVCLDVSVGAAVWVQSSFTGAELKALYEGEADTNAYDDAAVARLAQAITADGLTPLTANWDAGAFTLQALQLISDIVTGTAPFVVASTTVVANLNADTVDDIEGAEIVQRDGSIPLTANWDIGAFDITAEQFHSDIAIGTSPFTVVSTTVVANLNADLLDGIEAAEFLQRDGSIPLTADWDVGAFDITALQFHSDIVTGTSPFTVASTTRVQNLNADTVDGIEGAEIVQRDGSIPLTADWDVGAFDITALQFHSDIAIGTSPFTVVSTTAVANLNADLLDDIEAAEFLQRDASVPLTANWDVGAFTIQALQFISDIAIGTAPLVVTSTTVVANLNADTVDGVEGAEIVQRDGSVPLTGAWDAGAFDIRSLSTQQDAGAAAAAVAQRFGASATEGYEIKVIDETLAGLAAISTDLTEDIPDGAYILSVQSNIETLVVAGGTSAKVGIGPVADPDKYGLSSAFTKNLKTDVIPVHAVLSGAEDVQVNMVTAAGDIGDTVASAGAVRVRIVYAILNSLDDAA